MTKDRAAVETTLLGTLGLITIVVTPFISYDPINLPRFLALTIFGTVLLFLILIQKIHLITINYRLFLYLANGFAVWSLISLLLSDIGITDGFFGVPGRFNGVLTNLSFITFMTTSLLLSRAALISSFTNLLAITGVLSATYGLIQYQGHDPFDWINEYSPVFGFFGNPNFQASFMGITATAALALILNPKKKTWLNLCWVIYIPFAIFIISKSKSQQGFLVFAAGASVVMYIWIRSLSKFKKLIHSYLAIWILGSIAVIVDILQKSPWQSVLYKESVSYRGDFWRAGWNMTLQNPIFGVGLGGYGDNFRSYRDLASANRFEIGSNVDSAHNIFLDISSSGGFPLLAFYLGLVLLTLISAIKVIRRSDSFDFAFAGIFGAWVAYTAQSLISVSQIGIAIWGWVLSGAIIGFEINNRTNIEKVSIKSRATDALAISGGIILGLILTIPFFIADTEFRSTVKSGDVNKIMAAVQKWPQSVENMNFVTYLFRQGGFPDQSLSIARKAVKVNPKSFEAWQQLYISPNATESERKAALAKMKQLDPLNPTLK
jgi:O-antigen ligase